MGETALSALAEQVQAGIKSKSYEELESMDRLLRASLSELLSILGGRRAEPAEEFLKSAKRVFFAIREHVEGDYARNPMFYLGQLRAIAELAQMVRGYSVPAEAANIMMRSDVAKEIAKAVLAQGAISPTELGRRLERHSQNLVKVTKMMVRAGLLRRDEYGRSVRLSPTPLTAAALAYVEPNPLLAALDDGPAKKRAIG